jgi:hypothetical protein
MYTIYIYRLEDNVIVATVTGQTNEECEAKAEATQYSTNDHGWSYNDNGLTYPPH